MKEQGTVASTPLRDDHAALNMQSAATVRTPLRTIIAVLVVATVLACVERELSGGHDGSLLALLGSYAVKVPGSGHK
jgi:hypothetical protein